MRNLVANDGGQFGICELQLLNEIPESTMILPPGMQ
jgi:hypothetical protein